MHVSDDLYLGGFLPSGLSLAPTGGGGGERQQGVGPMGRIVFLNIVPLTVQTANIAALQAPNAGVALALAAGTGVTTGLAPDGSGQTVYQFDVARAVSLTSGSNLSAIPFTVVGYDFYGRKTSQTLNGPNANTVDTLKAFASVLSITPAGTSANTVSAGSSDIFGLQYVVTDPVYVTAAKWNATLAPDAGTLTVADTTNPATPLTGDPRGTYKPSANASNGVRRLIIAYHLDATQCGPAATITNVQGVTPA